MSAPAYSKSRTALMESELAIERAHAHAPGGSHRLDRHAPGSRVRLLLHPVHGVSVLRQEVLELADLLLLARDDLPG